VRPVNVNKTSIIKLMMEKQKILNHSYPDLVLAFANFCKEREMMKNLSTLKTNYPTFKDTQIIMTSISSRSENSKYFIEDYQSLFALVNQAIQ